MHSGPQPVLSVDSLFAERDARRSREREAEQNLKQQEKEHEAEYRKRLEAFEMTDALRQTFIHRIKHAFERGDTEVMLASFPSSFCSDSGRAISNAGMPPINKPTGKEKASASSEPDWLGTLPAAPEQSTNSGIPRSSLVASSYTKSQ
jgi:hypothetical protein